MRKEQRAIKDLKKQIEKDAGKRCKDFNINCGLCRVYLAVDILEDFYEFNFNVAKELDGEADGREIKK